MSHSYIKGVLWFLASLLISSTLDVFQKYLGRGLHPIEITFWRFFFGSISLLPFIINKEKPFHTTRLKMHIFRGILLFLGISIWCHGLTIVQISMATAINFTIPLFTLILAYPFLGEKIGKTKLIATVAGFLGVLIITHPNKNGINKGALILLLSSVFFSILDILNKRYVVKESRISMLFYTAFFTMLFSLIPSLFVWKWPSLQQILILFGIGLGANLILYCILKSFSYAEASSISTFRYTEFIFSVIYGLLIFGEKPQFETFLGLLLIIPSTFLITWHETLYKKKKLKKTHSL